MTDTSKSVLDREREEEKNQAPPVHASTAHSAAGRPAKMTNGLAPAMIRGT